MHKISVRELGQERRQLFDPLDRTSPGDYARTDWTWNREYSYSPKGVLHAAVCVQIARVFALEPIGEQFGSDSLPPRHEVYVFGVILEFPKVRFQKGFPWQVDARSVMNGAIDAITTEHPGMPIYCMLPGKEEEATEFLLSCGFQSIDFRCVDYDLARSLGYLGADSPARAPIETGLHVMRYGQDKTVQQSNIFSNLLESIAPLSSELRGFSNAQTKIRLRPTLDFWSPIQLYTTYSAYPVIRDFLDRVCSRVSMPAGGRVLIAPCGSGDFLRFWPKKNVHLVELFEGVDLREDFLELARVRLRQPEVDLLNLYLSAGLDWETRHGRIHTRWLTKIHDLLAQIGVNWKESDITNPDSVKMFARVYDEILQNRAIPDWYFPIKVLARMCGERDAVSARVLAGWLRSHQDPIRQFVQQEMATPTFPVEEFNLSLWSAARGIEAKCRLWPGDLTQEQEIPGGPYDLILCWEFIHILLSDIALLERFLDSLARRISPAGTLVITNIREERATVPEEHTHAKAILEKRGFDVESAFFDFSGQHVPYERRLDARYPVLFARRNKP